MSGKKLKVTNVAMRVVMFVVRALLAGKNGVLESNRIKTSWCFGQKDLEFTYPDKFPYTVGDPSESRLRSVTLNSFTGSWSQ